jgi:hypothetical protein
MSATRNTVYIAGPRADRPDNRASIETLVGLGYVVYNPSHIAAPKSGLFPGVTSEYWRFISHIHLLALCDAILRLPGSSSASDADVALAAERGIPTFHSVDDLTKALPAMKGVGV